MCSLNSCINISILAHNEWRFSTQLQSYFRLLCADSSSTRLPVLVDPVKASYKNKIRGTSNHPPATWINRINIPIFQNIVRINQAILYGHQSYNCSRNKQMRVRTFISKFSCISIIQIKRKLINQKEKIK